MINLGTVKPGSTIFIPFESFGTDRAPITISGLTVGDILVYKDGGTTRRASTSGFTLLDTDGIDFDSQTGIHGVSIDLSDNTTADFWAAGSRYFVVIGDITVDSTTMRFLAATFQIGYPAAVLDTTIATLATQTSFTLATGPAEDDALNGMWAMIHDAASAVQCAMVEILDYTGASKTVTLTAGATFTVAAKDNISVIGPSVAAIKAKTDNLPASPAAVGSAMTLTAAYDFAKGTTAMTESYAANTVAPTPVQALFAIHQMLQDFRISGTTLTVYKLDHVTPAYVVTLDDANNPTSALRT